MSCEAVVADDRQTSSVTTNFSVTSLACVVKVRCAMKKVVDDQPTD